MYTTKHIKVMQQLVRYITLLKCNNTSLLKCDDAFDILKNILQDMEHDNRVSLYSPNNDIIYQFRNRKNNYNYETIH